MIVSFCFISLKSNSEESDTGTALVHCTTVDNIYINRAQKSLIPACPLVKQLLKFTCLGKCLFALFYLLADHVPEPSPIG